MQGVFVDYERPASKKAVRAAIAAGRHVTLQATSMCGPEYDGPVADAPDGWYAFVGPDPFTRCSFYGTITKRDGKVTVS